MNFPLLLHPDFIYFSILLILLVAAFTAFWFANAGISKESIMNYFKALLILLVPTAFPWLILLWYKTDLLRNLVLSTGEFPKIFYYGDKNFIEICERYGFGVNLSLYYYCPCVEIWVFKYEAYCIGPFQDIIKMVIIVAQPPHYSNKLG